MTMTNEGSITVSNINPHTERPLPSAWHEADAQMADVINERRNVDVYFAIDSIGTDRESWCLTLNAVGFLDASAWTSRQGIENVRDACNAALARADALLAERQAEQAADGVFV